MNRPTPTVPIAIVTATKALAVATIVFNQPVALKGVPAYTTNLVGPTPISAVMTTPTTLTLTFSATIATATTLNIPFGDPGIRNTSGGYANAGSFPLS